MNFTCDLTIDIGNAVEDMYTWPKFMDILFDNFAHIHETEFKVEVDCEGYFTPGSTDGPFDGSYPDEGEVEIVDDSEVYATIDQKFELLHGYIDGRDGVAFVSESGYISRTEMPWMYGIFHMFIEQLRQHTIDQHERAIGSCLYDDELWKRYHEACEDRYYDYEEHDGR